MVFCGKFRDNLIYGKNDSMPGLSLCFQASLFSILSMIHALLILVPCLLYLHKKKNATPRSKTTFFLIKIGLSLCMMCLYGAELSEVLRRTVSKMTPTTTTYLYPLVEILCIVLVILVMALEVKRNSRNSGCDFTFWLILFVFHFVHLWSIWQLPLQAVDRDLPLLVIYFIRTVFIMVLLPMSCISEHVSIERTDDENRKPCPENDASFLSRILVWWFNDLIIKGYRKPLTEADLWELNHQDKTAYMERHFLKNLQRYIKLGRAQRKLIRRAQPGISKNGNLTTPPPSTLPDIKIVVPNKSFHGSPSKQASTTKSQGFDFSLLKALLRTYGLCLLRSAVYKLCQDSLLLLGPILLKRLMILLEQPAGQPMWPGYALVVAMFIVASAQSLALNRYFNAMFLLGMQVRTVLVAGVYRKALLLSNAARRDATSGEVVNLMSVDSQKFLELMPFLNMLWSAPLQICVALYLLWQEMGVSVLAGVFVMLLLVPINVVLGHFTRQSQVRQMKHKDTRMKLMNEILNGLKVLKLYAWEPFFIKQVEEVREVELRELRISAFLQALNIYTFMCAPFIVSLTTFAVYVLSSKDHILDAEKAFVALSLFNILRFPLITFPTIITSLIQATVSLQRLTKYLKLPELKLDNVNHFSDSLALQPWAARIVNGTFAWDTNVDKDATKVTGQMEMKNDNAAVEEEVPLKCLDDAKTVDGATDNVTVTLKDISIDFPLGKLTAIVGPVGAGKSSLLSALLGEMERLSGEVAMCGRVAYVPQQAWIQNATVRDNILFHASRDHFRHFQKHTSDDSEVAYSDLLHRSNISLQKHVAKCQKYEVDEKRYRQVVKLCQLEPDLAILPAGDETEIGEKGVNLSGGQKQRLSVARACYADADLYLFDDPLSAVDAHVAKHLIDDVLDENGLLRGKTRILVTHNVTVLPRCGHIVVLQHGRVLQQGSYEHLMRHDTEATFATFIATHLLNAQQLPDMKEDESISDSVDKLLARHEETEETVAAEVRADLEEKQRILHDIESSLALSNKALSAEVEHSLVTSKQNLAKSTESLNMILKNNRNSPQSRRSSGKVAEQSGKAVSAGRRLIEAEKMEEGRVVWRVYWTYLKAVGVPLSIGIFVAFACSHASVLGANIWLAEWATKARNLSQALKKMPADNATISLQLRKDRDFYLGIYGAFVGGQSIGILVTGLLFAVASITSSRRLHDRLLHRVLRLPQTQLDSLPLGRILNRFGSDLATVDQSLTMQWRFLLNTTLGCIFTLVGILVPSAWIGLPLLVLSVFYFFMQRMYVSTTRQLKRLESVSRSPIYSHFGETLQGVSVIRAFQQSAIFTVLLHEAVDRNQRAYYPSIQANRWLATRLEFVGNIIVLMAGLFAVLSRHYGWSMSAGYAGLAITYAVSVTPLLNFMVRTAAEVEASIVSVERIREYVALPIEPPWDISEARPPPDWPSGGEVRVENYQLRYQDSLPPVLHNLNFTIRPSEKVGIVGRTGSGKSSLVLGLFRIVEPMAGSRILLDGRDIGQMGLHDVRGRMSVIPQDPVLFAGSLRMNLDPAGSKSDDDLWTALERAHLKDFVMRTAGGPDAQGGAGLDMKIAEGGQNLSVGQRQLVCLARALLRQSRLLVLDEATAAVDLDTDQLIQDTIRRDFANSTVITIAHRLHTVMDYDKVLVMDAGRILEFDSPQNLIAKPNSVFASMVKATNI